MLPVIVAILFATFGPSLGRSREAAVRIKCGSNLRQVGMAARQYALVNGGAYPPVLQTLLAAGAITPDMLICPNSTATSRRDPQKLERYSSYVYLGGHLTDQSPATALVAYEHIDHHQRDGFTVLFADGSARFVVADELHAALSKLHARPTTNPSP